jgi:flagellar biosynthesis anti-sigma factor FlgM
MSTNRIGSPGTQPSMPSSSGNVGQDTVTKASESAAANAISSIGSAVGNSAKKMPKGNFDVNISSHAKDRAVAFQKAFDIAKATPDIREDRVKALKEQIQNGSYKVDSGDIADAMLREAVKEHLADTDGI